MAVDPQHAAGTLIHEGTEYDFCSRGHLLPCVAVLAEAKQESTAGLKRRGTVARVLVVLATGLFVALLAYGLLSKASNDRIDTSLGNGQAAPAPGFELPVLQRGRLGARLDRWLEPALADGRVNLKELRGSPVVLNFWASWCVPCRIEAPRLEHAWRAGRRRGVVFAGLNMQDVTEDARSFMSNFRMSYLNVRDKSNDVSLDWGVTGIPETFFVTARGRVVAHVIGAVSAAQLRRGVAAAVEGKPLAAAQGGEREGTR
jgi:cytochrome c biogenesis protein CcmG, thiol:disulfide interchange protein DsbE